MQSHVESLSPAVLCCAVVRCADLLGKAEISSYGENVQDGGFGMVRSLPAVEAGGAVNRRKMQNHKKRKLCIAEVHQKEPDPVVQSSPLPCQIPTHEDGRPPSSCTTPNCMQIVRFGPQFPPLPPGYLACRADANGCKGNVKSCRDQLYW